MKKKYYKYIVGNSFDFITPDSPIELIDASAYYDVESFEYYLVVRMRNVSRRRISSLRVKLKLYDGSPIPYKKLEYTYKVKGDGDIIGEKDYIHIPQSFYKKFDFIIEEVCYSNGEREIINLSSMSGKPRLISEQSKEIVAACELLEENETVKESYPAIILPQFTSNAWICCCSHKNPSDAESCERCSRERDALMAIYSGAHLTDVLRREAQGTASMTQRRRKGEFLDKKTPKTVDNAKERLIDEQIEKVEKREKYKDKMRVQALPRLVLYFVGSFLIYLLICLVSGRL